MLLWCSGMGYSLTHSQTGSLQSSRIALPSASRWSLPLTNFAFLVSASSLTLSVLSRRRCARSKKSPARSSSLTACARRKSCANEPYGIFLNDASATCRILPLTATFISGIWRSSCEPSSLVTLKVWNLRSACSTVAGNSMTSPWRKIVPAFTAPRPLRSSMFAFVQDADWFWDGVLKFAFIMW